MPLLDSVRPAFADRNVPLHLLLGLISLGKRLDRYVPDAPAAAQAGVRDARDPAPAPAEPSPRFLYVVLGIVSFRRTLMAELEAVRPARPTRRRVEAAVLPAAIAPAERHLLR